MVELRVNIKFCVKIGKSATEMFDLLEVVHGESVLERSAVPDWHRRFREGREEVEDDVRSEDHQFQTRMML